MGFEPEDTLWVVTDNSASPGVREVYTGEHKGGRVMGEQRQPPPRYLIQDDPWTRKDRFPIDVDVPEAMTYAEAVESCWDHADEVWEAHPKTDELRKRVTELETAIKTQPAAYVHNLEVRWLEREVERLGKRVAELEAAHDSRADKFRELASLAHDEGRRRGYAACQADVVALCRTYEGEDSLEDLVERGEHVGAAQGPKTPTIEDVQAGAERASERVKRWPKWMLELSPTTEHLADGDSDE